MYSPLEIILSDDCSQDRTFEIMKEMAENYKGPHKVILNRNERSLGIGGHINRIMEISHGELIVVAAGDDVSLPDRTAISVEAWLKSGRTATSIHTLVNSIDEKGNFIETCNEWFQYLGGLGNSPLGSKFDLLKYYVNNLRPAVFGCSHAFSRNLFNVFGPLIDSVVNEDTALAFRTHLIGRLLSINVPLVLYRTHSSNICNKKKPISVEREIELEEKNRKIHTMRMMYVYENMKRDALIAAKRGFISMTDFLSLERDIDLMLEYHRVQLEFDSFSLSEKVKFIWLLKSKGLNLSSAKSLLWRCLPKKIYLKMKSLKRLISTRQR